MILKLLKLFSLIFIFQGCIRYNVTQSNIFNPVKEYELSDNFEFDNFFIKNTDSLRLEIWYMKEKTAAFNLIYISGNGSNIRSAIPFFNQLEKKFDLNIYSFNYSGYGLSNGKPSVSGIISDGEIALKYFKNEIKDQNLPTYIIGYSLGGYVALHLIKDDIIQKGVIMSSFSSIEELQSYLLKETLPGIIRPFLKLKIDDDIYSLNNIPLVMSNIKPILFIHGESDDFIPSLMSSNLYQLSSAREKKLSIIPNAGHRTILKDTLINKLVIDEIAIFLNL